MDTPTMEVETSWEQSAAVGAIGGALAKAQAEIKNAAKTSDNPFFKSKYADLAEVKDACWGPLTANGIAVVQAPLSRGKRAGVRTMLVHSSGEWLACTALATPKDEGPQSYGSVVTYLRRYSLAGFAGVATEDDDGNDATHGDKKPPVAGGAAKANTVKATPTALMANASQIQQIHIMKEKIGGWTGKAEHPGHPYKLGLAGYKDAKGQPVLTSTMLTYEQAVNFIKRMQGLIDRQAETLAKAEAGGHMEAATREPGSDDDVANDNGEPCDPGMLEEVREAAKKRWGKKTPDLAPQWLQKEFGVESTAALSKWQASQALQMLLSGDTL